jgi:hypothetical protein
MMTSSDHMTFGQIASHWVLEPETFPLKLRRPLTANSGANAVIEAEAAILNELVAAIQNREFDQMALSISGFWHHAGQQTTNIDGVPLADRQGRVEPGYVPFGRNDLPEPHHGVSFVDYVKAVAKDRDKVSEEHRGSEYPLLSSLAEIRIGRDDFAKWCKDRRWVLPRFWFCDGVAVSGDGRKDKQEKRSVGRPPGIGSYDDEALIDEMHRLIASGDASSELDAANQVAEIATGGGTWGSKVDRLRKKYPKKYPPNPP